MVRQCGASLYTGLKLEFTPGNRPLAERQQRGEGLRGGGDVWGVGGSHITHETGMVTLSLRCVLIETSKCNGKQRRVRGAAAVACAVGLLLRSLMLAATSSTGAVLAPGGYLAYGGRCWLRVGLASGQFNCASAGHTAAEEEAVLRIT
ncbi:hypothetical protein MRX96_049658 [Rhipicephalus microplus]